MNKEYIYLSDKELLVIDENGHATKRNIESDNMHDMLLLENDLEKINNTIIRYEKIIHQDEEAKLTKKRKVILAMVPFIIGMSAYGIACLINPSAFSHIIPVTIGFAMGTAAIDASFILGTIHHSYHINGIKSGLSTAYQLREELEQRLRNVKVNSKDFIEQDMVDSKKKNQKINDVVILEESTQFCEEAQKQLNESYTTGYEQRGPVLTKKLTPPKHK